MNSDTLEHLNLSYNDLEGLIPITIAQLSDARVSLNGNEDL